MKIRDDKIDASGYAGRQVLTPAIPTAVSQTRRQFFCHTPGHAFQLTDVAVACAALTAGATVDVYLMGPDEIVAATTFAQNSGTDDTYDLTAFQVRVGGRLVEKTAVSAGTFTAAHKITALKFGCVLFQISNAGTISTKVAAATQAYDSAAEALAALPAADADNIAFGVLAIEAGASDWDANTDDLTSASDATTVVFTPVAATVARATTAALTPVANEEVAGTLATSKTAWRDLTGEKSIVGVYTTDSDAALTNAVATITYRPYPMHGESR